MARIDKLRRNVKELYEAKVEGQDPWSEWLYPNHVLVVAKFAVPLAEKYGANVELTEVAALLHDIADVKMPRKDPRHEEESLKIARQVMQDCGYTAEETQLVVDDAVRFHSCHGDERPESKEGLILATADSQAHLKTDFYVYATWAFGRDRSLEALKEWVAKKIERDLHNKISFDDEREDARKDYEVIKELFSR